MATENEQELFARQSGIMPGALPVIPVDLRAAQQLNTGIRQAQIDQRANPASNAPKDIANYTIPVYGTLPPNAGNFNLTQFVSKHAGATATNFVCFSTDIPPGRVLYLKEVACNVTQTYNGGGATLGIPNVNVSISVFVNGSADVFNQGIILQPLEGFNPIFVIAPPQQTLTVAITYDFSAIAVPPATVDILTHCRGDFIPVNDMPTQYTALKSRR